MCHLCCGQYQNERRVAYHFGHLGSHLYVFSPLSTAIEADNLFHAVSCLSASFFAVAQGHANKAITYQHAGAAQLLVVSLLGWYIFLSHILQSVDFPFCLPLGDLSTVVPGMTKPQNETEEQV